MGQKEVSIAKGKPFKLARRVKPIYNDSTSLAGGAEGEVRWAVKV
jgi:hypothetical protein